MTGEASIKEKPHMVWDIPTQHDMAETMKMKMQAFLLNKNVH